MLAGNDVVDLGDPETQPGAIHPRWDARVFTADERMRVLDAASPHRVRWRHWAAKESAFKVAAKLQPGLAFLPTRFVVEVLDSVSATVQHNVGRFRILFTESDDWVHAVATPEGVSLSGSMLGTLSDGADLATDNLGGIPCSARRASIEVRSLARKAIGTELGLDPTEISISTGKGIPIARHGESPLPVDLSLSHHGRFLACAWVATGA